MAFDIQLDGFEVKGITEFTHMTGYGIKEVNTEKNEVVKPVISEAIEWNGNLAVAQLEPLSWNVIRFAL